MNEDVNTKLDFLRTQLKTNIDGFRARQADSKRKGFLIRMTVVVLGALTTVLLGLKANTLFSSYDSAMSAAALVLSATIPIFSAWDAFYDHRWLWIRYAAAQQGLYGILDDLEYAGPNISSDKLDELYARFRAVLQETNSAWRDKVTKMEMGDASKSDRS
jgi:hypothetical protein